MDTILYPLVPLIALFLWCIVGTVVWLNLREILRPSLPLTLLVIVITGPVVWALNLVAAILYPFKRLIRLIRPLS